MSYIDKATYLLRDKTIDILKRTQSKQNNVSFVQMMSTGSRSVLKLCRIIAIKDLKNLVKGTRLMLGSVVSTHYITLGLTLKVNKS